MADFPVSSSSPEPVPLGQRESGKLPMEHLAHYASMREQEDCGVNTPLPTEQPRGGPRSRMTQPDLRKNMAPRETQK